MRGGAPAPLSCQGATNLSAWQAGGGPARQAEEPGRSVGPSGHKGGPFGQSGHLAMMARDLDGSSRLNSTRSEAVQACPRESRRHRDRPGRSKGDGRCNRSADSSRRRQKVSTWHGWGREGSGKRFQTLTANAVHHNSLEMQETLYHAASYIFAVIAQATQPRAVQADPAKSCVSKYSTYGLAEGNAADGKRAPMSR